MPRPPMDDYETAVILKREGDTALAVFPSLAGDCHKPFTCTCYAHVGQHGSADVGYAAALPRLLASDPKATALLRELASVGYRVKLRRRFTQRDTAERRAQLRMEG